MGTISSFRLHRSGLAHHRNTTDGLTPIRSARPRSLWSRWCAYRQHGIFSPAKNPLSSAGFNPRHFGSNACCHSPVCSIRVQARQSLPLSRSHEGPITDDKLTRRTVRDRIAGSVRGASVAVAGCEHSQPGWTKGYLHNLENSPDQCFISTASESKTFQLR